MLQHKESVSKKAFFSAEELAKELNVKKFLVKSWEREFRVTPEHPAGGSKCYSQENLKTFVAIKDLLLNKKMTFSQAKRVLGAREAAAPAKPEAAIVESVAAAQDSTVTAVEVPVSESAAAPVQASSVEAVVTEKEPIAEVVVAQEVIAPINDVQAALVSEDSIVEAVEMEAMATAEVSVAPVAQDDLVQPAVMPQESEAEPRATSVRHEKFMQKIRDFKKQLLDFKEQLDLES